MQMLIEDLLMFSRVGTQSRPVRPHSTSSGPPTRSSPISRPRSRPPTPRSRSAPCPRSVVDAAADPPAAPEPDLERDQVPARGRAASGQDRRRGPRPGGAEITRRRQRDRLRSPLRRPDLPRLRAAPRPRRVPGHRHRARPVPEDRRAPRRLDRGREHARTRGPTFTVTLPLKQRSGAEPRRRHAERRPRTGGALVSEGEAITILIADDDEEDRVLTQEALRRGTARQRPAVRRRRRGPDGLPAPRGHVRRPPAKPRCPGSSCST